MSTQTNIHTRNGIITQTVQECNKPDVQFVSITLGATPAGRKPPSNAGNAENSVCWFLHRDPGQLRKVAAALEGAVDQLRGIAEDIETQGVLPGVGATECNDCAAHAPDVCAECALRDSMEVA